MEVEQNNIHPDEDTLDFLFPASEENSISPNLISNTEAQTKKILTNQQDPSEMNLIKEKPGLGLQHTQSAIQEFKPNEGIEMEFEKSTTESPNQNFEINEEILNNLETITKDNKFPDEEDVSMYFQMPYDTRENTQKDELNDKDDQSTSKEENLNNPQNQLLNIPRNNIVDEEKPSLENIVSSKMETENPDNDSKVINKLGSNGKFAISNEKLTKEELIERYKPIIYVNQDDDAACVVCLEEDACEGDEIVFCDLCNSAFHQSCYGSDLLTLNLESEDDSEWYCERCSHLIKNDLPFKAVKCEFCPEMKGAIKRVKSDSDKLWAHIVCVNWIPEIYYMEEQLKTNVTIETYHTKKNYERNKLLCKLCEIKYGDCIQCDKDICTLAFHITCAMRRGLIGKWDEMVSLKRESDGEYYSPIYCKTHMKAENQKMFEYCNQTEKRYQSAGEQLSYMLGTPVHKSSERSSKSAKAKHASQISVFDGSSEKKKRRELKRFYAPVIINLELNENGQYCLEKDKKSAPKLQKLSKIRDNKQEEKKEKEQTNKKEVKKERIKKLSKISTISPDKPKKSDLTIMTTEVDEINSSGKIEKRKSFKENEELQKEPLQRYKFKTDMAKLMNHYSWADEKEIKKVLQEYFSKHKLYDSKKKELDVSGLMDMLGVSKIPREQIFNKFMTWMYKKSLAESSPKNVFRVGLDPEEKIIKKIKFDANVSEKLERQTSRKNEETIHQKAKIDGKAENFNPENKPKEKVDNRNKYGQNSMQIEEPPVLIKKRSEPPPNNAAPKLKKNPSASELNRKKEQRNSFDTTDFMSQFVQNKPPLPPQKKTINSSEFLQNILGDGNRSGNERPSSSNYYKRDDGFGGLSAIISRSDQFTFRKNMKWFTRVGSNAPQVETIFSNEARNLLWPKGAELLF